MKWTKHNLLFFSSMSTRLQRPCILRVLFSLLLVVGFLVPSSSVADEAADINHIRGTVDIISEYIQDTQMEFFQDWKQDQLQALEDITPVDFQNRVMRSLVGRSMNESFSWSETDNIRSYLEALTRSVFGAAYHTSNPLPGSLLDYQKKQLARLSEALALLAALTNSSSSSSISPDILAGNPWWATNSAFSHLYTTASQVHPTVSGNNLMSFPELMSFWSAQLMPFSGSGRVNASNPSAGDYWLKMWGLNRQNSGNTWQGRSFSWFDFMGEIAKSNLVADTTRYNGISRSLADIYQVLSQLDVSPSVSVTNLLTVIVTNSVSGAGFTNILNAPDILAANPWWATNSGFSLDWYNLVRTGAYPSSYPYYSFPQMLSFLSSAFWQPNISEYPYDVPYLDRWGKYGANWKMGVITFNDWLADYLKSNLVSYASTSSDEYRASQLDSSTTSVAEEGYLALTNAVEEATETADEATSLEPSFSPTTGSYSNPYDPIGELITTVGEDISDKMPDFNESTEEVITLFDGRSGTPMDAAGAVQVNLREAMGEHVNTLGNVMSWFWTTLNAILTIVLVVRSLHEIGEAI